MVLELIKGPIDIISEIICTPKNYSQTSVCIRITWWVWKFSSLLPLPFPHSDLVPGKWDLGICIFTTFSLILKQVDHKFPLWEHCFKEDTYTNNELVQKTIQFLNILKYLLYYSSIVPDIKFLPHGVIYLISW